MTRFNVLRQRILLRGRAQRAEQQSTAPAPESPRQLTVGPGVGGVLASCSVPEHKPLCTRVPGQDV
eukprot:1578481-Pyramimonas_sp.AAC.1